MLTPAEVNKQYERDFEKMQRHAKIAAGKLTQPQRDFIMDVSNDKNLVAYTKKTTIQISAGTILHVPQGNGDFLTKPLNTNVFKNLLLSGLFEIDTERESFMPHTKRYRFSKLGMEIADEVCGRNQRKLEEARITELSSRLDMCVAKISDSQSVGFREISNSVADFKRIVIEAERCGREAVSQFERDGMQIIAQDAEAIIKKIIAMTMQFEAWNKIERPSKVSARAGNKQKLESLLEALEADQQAVLESEGEEDVWKTHIENIKSVIATL